MKIILQFLSLVPLCACSLLAQSITASMAGNVRDASGAVVPAAKITITDVERNQVVRRTITDSAGNYVAPLLPIGSYAVSVEANGFKKATRSGVILNVNDQATVNFSLQVGEVAEQVNVEEAPVSVELQSSAQSNVVSGTQIRDLELNTRNFAQLVSLVPGVSSANTDQLFVGHSAPAGSSTSISFAVNGSRADANNWLVDGADNIDRGANGNLLTYPSLDAIAEFKVLRSSYSADLGRSAGGQINVVTKSGTSQFHGDAYEFVRNDAFAANNFLNNANSVNLGPDGKARVPPLRYNDFGYTLGGPVYIPHHYNTEKNKTFFFFSEEFRRVITHSTPTATLPTASEKNGIFPNPVCIAVSGGVCTQTGTQITKIDPVAAAYIKDIFAPAPSGATGTNLFFPDFRNVFQQRQELYKVDHNFGPRLSVFVRYLTDKIPTMEPAGYSSGSAIPGLATTTTNAPGHSWVARAIATLSPTWLNEAGFNYSYGAVLSTPVGTDASASSPDIKINLPFPVTLGRVPSVTFGGGGSGVQGFGPYLDYNRNYNFYDNMTKIVGRHTMRFGFTQNFYQKSENAASTNVGSFSFTGPVRPAGTSVFEQSWADFLVGRAASFTQASLDLFPDIRVRQSELYFQDDIRISKNLTINAGVRYSIFRQPIDNRNMLTNFDPAAFNRSAAPQIDPKTGNILPNTGNALNGIIINKSSDPYGQKSANEDWGNVAPRFGFAWDPTGRGKTSIRSGYGIFYDSILYGIYEQNVFANPPFVNSITIPNTLLSDPTSGTPTISLAPKVLHGTPIPYRTPYSQQWNFDIQQQVTKDFLIDVGYVGSKGTHLTGIIDLNQAPPGAAIAAGLVSPGTVFTSTNSPLLNAVRPYSGYNSINSVETWFNSNYNALQVSVEKRFSGSSLLKVSYAFSKNLTDNASDRSNAPQNSYNFHEGEYGLAAYDRRNVLIFNYVYELPFLKNQQGLKGHILGGWEVSGITTFQSGLPSEVSSSLGTDPAGLGVGGSSSAVSRPDAICNPNANAPRTQFAWFNTSCFAPVPAGQVRPGNAGPYTIRGPGLNRWDFSLFKNVKIRERATLQIRGEFYNLFNHTNPNTFGVALGSTTYGQITAYRDPRILQLAAKLYF
jgi:hypothetical protein